MPKFIVELWLDGYESEEEMEKACEEFIYEQLNFTASGVKITKIDDYEYETCPECGETWSGTSCGISNCGWIVGDKDE